MRGCVRTRCANVACTAEPVASATLVRRGGFGLSSATVRNVLARLEDEGYVQQPHTSAGRVPTDLGYRFYVDGLLGPQPLAPGEQEQIDAEQRGLGQVSMNDVYNYNNQT